MRRLIALLAARCGGMINMAKLASELTITELTVLLSHLTSADRARQRITLAVGFRAGVASCGADAEPVQVGCPGNLVGMDEFAGGQFVMMEGKAGSKALARVRHRAQPAGSISQPELPGEEMPWD